MGAEVLIPLAIAAAGSGASAYNADRTAKRQDQAAAAGIRQQGVRQREADRRVDTELDELAGSNPEAERRAANDQFMAQLQATRGTATGSTPGVPGAAARYGEQVSTNADASAATAAKVADLMSRVSSPLLQRQREGQGFARSATDIGMIGRAAAGDDFLNQLRLRAIRPNPWIDAAGGVAQGYAANMAGPSAGSASTAPPRWIPRTTGPY
jgi:hypothetical protein